jgi:heat shock protein HslJ
MHVTSAKFLVGAAVIAVFAGCSKKTEDAAPEPAAETAAVPAAPAIAPLRATGNEPFWRVDLGESAVVLTTPDGEVRAGAPVLDTTFEDGSVLYVAKGEGGEIAVKVVDRLCTDTMTGMPHPQSVQVWSGGQELRGCGGEPATLLQGGEWTVDEFGGQAPVKDSKITLNFGADGSLSGSTSCNRLATTYTLSGEGLAIAQGAGTMMACDAPVMEQEKAILELLAGVNSFGVADDGALLLKTADGKTIRARR